MKNKLNLNPLMSGHCCNLFESLGYSIDKENLNPLMSGHCCNGNGEDNLDTEELLSQSPYVGSLL